MPDEATSEVDAAHHLLNLGSFKRSSIARAYSQVREEDARHHGGGVGDPHEQIPRARVMPGPRRDRDSVSDTSMAVDVMTNASSATSHGTSCETVASSSRMLDNMGVMPLLRDRNSSNVSNVSVDAFGADAPMTVGEMQSLSSGGLAPMVPDFPPNVFSGAGDLHASVTAPSQASSVAGAVSTLSSSDIQRDGITLVTPPASLTLSSQTSGAQSDTAATQRTSESLTIALSLDHHSNGGATVDDALVTSGAVAGGSGTADALVSDSSSSMFSGHSCGAVGAAPHSLTMTASIMTDANVGSGIARQLADTSMALAAPPALGETPPGWFSKGAF